MKQSLTWIEYYQEMLQFTPTLVKIKDIQVDKKFVQINAFIVFL